MTERVYQHLKRTGMIGPGDRLAVAVSGGADSVALLELLVRLRERLGIALAVAHFNHRLRGEESDADAAFVRELAARHSLPFFSQSEDIAAEARRRGANLEAIARRRRYAFLSELVEGGRADKVATAHTADDQAETVLARLLRGAGTRGLAGIYPEVGGWLVRPLLEQRRAGLRAWLAAEGLAWREDSSNRDLRLTRNRLRADVLPMLETFNPRLVEHLSAAAEIARDEEEFWSHRAAELLPQVSGLRSQVSGRGSEATLLKLALPAFVQLHRAEQRRVLRAALRYSGYAGPLDIAQVEALRRLATDGVSGQSLCLSGLAAVRVFEALELRPAGAAQPPPGPGGYEYRVGVPGECTISATGTRLRFDLVGRSAGEKGYNNYEELLDRDAIQTPLVVRNWQAGDVFESPTGQRFQKVKRLLLRRRVPADERRRWPVVVSGGKIVWVRGFPVARSVRAKPASPAAVRIREEAQ